VIAVIGIVLIAGVVACLVDPFGGMLTLMFINMVQPGELYHVFNVLHVERIVALLTIFMMLARGMRFVFPPLAKRMLYFFGATVASIPLAFWISNSITSDIEFAKTIILAMVLVALVTNRRRLRVVLALYCVLVGYLAGSGVVQYLEGNFQVRMHVDRLVGLTNASNNPDTLGLTIATALPIVFLFTLKGNPAWMRWGMRALIVLLLIALLLTGSRGSLLTFVTMFVLALAVSRRRMLLLPAAAVLAAAIWVLLPPQYQARYETVDHLKHDESYQNRLISWDGGIHMFLHNPLTGIGIGNYVDANGAKYWPTKPRFYLDAHSLYFKILGELGLLGVITFTAFVATFFKVNARIRALLLEQGDAPPWLRFYPLACNLVIIGLLYCGYAYHDVYRSTWYFFAALSAALLLTLERERTSRLPAAGEPAALALGRPA
jgi:probable O-glycosylation ligase (exosortase A-associated)